MVVLVSTALGAKSPGIVVLTVKSYIGNTTIMPGWRAHRKECWFIAVQDILCEFLAHSLVLEILKWANRHGPIKKGLSKNENKDGGRKEVGASTGF